jgi:hypothetical protein
VIELAPIGKQAKEVEEADNKIAMTYRAEKIVCRLGWTR